MSIRPMTSEEIRRALRRGAEVCITSRLCRWYGYEALQSDGAAWAAADCARIHEGMADSPAHAANFLLLCAEAHE